MQTIFIKLVNLNNIMIQTNVIHGAFNQVEQLFLGSSCIYPKHANQPITGALLSGLLELQMKCNCKNPE